MKIDIEKLVIKFDFRDDDDKMPARASITIGQFEIRGFKIMKSTIKDCKDRFVLFPPSVKAGAFYMHIAYVQDKNEWAKIQEKVLKQFEEELEEYLMKSLHDKEKLDNVKFS